MDTQNYEDALKNTLRQAPDVILIGEIRSQDTMEYALSFAETGHLCLSTLHANNANQALDRIINFFPEERRNQLLMDLSLNLRAFVSQRLVPTVDGKRAAAIEILLGTPLVSDLVRKGEIHTIKEVMEKSESIGMQTFDNHLIKLYQQGRISAETAIKNADSANNVRLKISLSQGLQRKTGEAEPADQNASQIDALQHSAKESALAETGSPSGPLSLSLEPISAADEEEEKASKGLSKPNAP